MSAGYDVFQSAYNTQTIVISQRKIIIRDTADEVIFVLLPQVPVCLFSWMAMAAKRNVLVARGVPQHGGLTIWTRSWY